MSVIKSIKQVLGLSGTSSENHFWDGSVPNQLSLKRGTPEAPGTTVMQVVAGVVTSVNQVREAFRATSAASQTLTTGVFTKVLFQTEEFDFSSSYDPALSRFTPKSAGAYQVNAQVLVGNTTRSVLNLSIYKNGVSVQQFRGRVDAALAQNTGISAVISMNGTTDYLEIFCQQNTGTDLNIITPDTWFSAAKVGV